MLNIGPWKKRKKYDLEIKSITLHRDKESLQRQVQAQEMKIFKLKEKLQIIVH
jgi:hypothetical protein